MVGSKEGRQDRQAGGYVICIYVWVRGRRGTGPYRSIRNGVRIICVRVDFERKEYFKLQTQRNLQPRGWYGVGK